MKYIGKVKKVHIPKDLVPSYLVGDDITKCFAAHEMALRVQRVREEDWGASLWKHMTIVGRDALLTLEVADLMRYDP